MTIMTKTRYKGYKKDKGHKRDKGYKKDKRGTIICLYLMNGIVSILTIILIYNRKYTI